MSGYLSQGQLPAQGYYNTTGRAFPDVSAFSENVVIVVGGGQTFVGGIYIQSIEHRALERFDLC